MIDASAVRRIALALPEVSEQPHFDRASFRVRGKVVATLDPDERSLNVFVDEHETRAAVAADPHAYAECRWGARLAGVTVTLSAAAAGDVRELLESAWRRKAPARLVREHDQSSS